MRLYVTDTLDDPNAAETQISFALKLIAASRRKANKIKASADVTVVIGNPPYKELAIGEGGWVEQGGQEHGGHSRPILEDFYVQGGGRFKAKLKNLYVYFWRWATWKVWESTSRKPGGDAGIVCFITTSGYLTGLAFTGMREYLRRHASEGWIIDLTPEGQTPDIPTRIFPGVRQPLAIGMFVRQPGTSTQQPAAIHYMAVTGRQADKFAALAAIHLDDRWHDVRTGWGDPLTPAAAGDWDNYPALSDLMPWYSPGVFPTRTWVYAPDPETLRTRWRILMGEKDPQVQSGLFKEGRDATMDKAKEPLPGTDTHNADAGPLRHDKATQPSPVRVGYRSFDVQWVLPDSRLMDMPRRDLWAARIPGQVFVIEQHSHVISNGPGIVMSALIPDFDHFNTRGGRTLVFLHPDGSPNLAPGLLQALAARLGRQIDAAEVLAYIAAVTAHPAYTQRFIQELTTPGIRIPISGEAQLWDEAARIGGEVIWLHTYGAEHTGPERPRGTVRFAPGDQRQPLCTKAVSAMPATMAYDETTTALRVGDGEFAPVSRAVWEYAVGGKNVLKGWFNYRKRDPGGKKNYPLDLIHPETWNPNWTTELIDLLSVLTRLTAIESAQADLLTRILDGRLLSSEDLQAAGTRWPQDKDDRKPHYSYDSLATSSPMEGQLRLEL